MRNKIGMSAILLLTATIMLKLSGLIRDIFIANYFGDSYVVDAYLAAFIIPNMLFLYMQNGMKNVFIPKYYHDKQNNLDGLLLSNVMKGTLIVSVGVSLVFYVITPFLVQLLYPTFDESAFTITVYTIRILMVAFIVVSINAVLESYLDATERYYFSTFSQAIVWLTMILMTIIFAKFIGIYVLAIGYLIGAILSFLFKAVIVKDFHFLNSKVQLGEVQRFYATLLPIGLTVMIGQLNLTVDNIFASYFDEGAITYINYAKNIVHLPQTIIVTIVGTIFFAKISSYYAEKRYDLFQNVINTTNRVTLLLTLPAILGIACILPQLIELLFERGAFQREATNKTALVAYYYLGSAFFFSINVVWNKALYTMGKGHLLLRIGMLSILFNFLLNFIFIQTIGYYGIPLASSFVGLYYTISTYLVYKKVSPATDITPHRLEYVKIILASICMLLIVFLINDWILSFQPITYVLMTVIIGICVYLLSLILLRSTTFSFLIANISKQKQMRDT